MARDFPEASAALLGFASNFRYGSGSHLHERISSDAEGLLVGEVPFDPEVHDPSTINHLSLLGIATGEHYVTEISPENPLHISIVVDLTRTNEVPSVTEAKQKAAWLLRYLLEDDALPNSTDKVLGNIVTTANGNWTGGVQTASNEFVLEGDSITIVDGREQAASAIADIALGGLTIVISDFYRMRFAPNSLESVIAVKVAHPSEIELPANLGVISLGDDVEVNTNDPVQLANFNKDLRQYHQEIVDRLEESGAAVAEVTALPNTDDGFSFEDADKAIADALNALQRKH